MQTSAGVVLVLAEAPALAGMPTSALNGGQNGTLIPLVDAKWNQQEAKQWPVVGLREQDKTPKTTLGVTLWHYLRGSPAASAVTKLSEKQALENLD